jgi:hypothetical protein
MILSMQRSDHSGLTPQEIGDRLAIRELGDAYAHRADRRSVEGEMSLFTADTEFLVYMDSRNAVPTQEIRGRDDLRAVFENLSTYEATHGHFTSCSLPQKTHASIGHTAHVQSTSRSETDSAFGNSESPPVRCHDAENAQAAAITK